MRTAAGWSAGWRPLPAGRFTGAPALGRTADGFVLYVRGQDGACWTFDPARPAAGWHSMGGRFVAGFSAFEGNVVGRGANQRVYEWLASLPSWRPVQRGT